MKKALLYILLVPINALACMNDSQCGHGSRCQRPNDPYTKGQCVSTRDKFGQVDEFALKKKQEDQRNSKKGLIPVNGLETSAANTLDKDAQDPETKSVADRTPSQYKKCISNGDCGSGGLCTIPDGQTFGSCEP